MSRMQVQHRSRKVGHSATELDGREAGGDDGRSGLRMTNLEADGWPVDEVNRTHLSFRRGLPKRFSGAGPF